MGSSATFVPAPLSGADVKKRVSVVNAYSQVWRLGKTILSARQAQTDPVAAVVEPENGVVLFKGKVSDVIRKTAASFVRGDLVLT